MCGITGGYRLANGILDKLDAGGFAFLVQPSVGDNLTDPH